MFGLNVAARALLAGGLPAASASTVFDIDTWTGTGSARSITTPFAPSMVWIKQRSSTESHGLFDTTRGATKYISSNATTAETADAQTLTAFNAGGYSLGTGGSIVNTSAATYVGYAFKEAANFFDVVTYTGDGTSDRPIAHTLGVAPGMILLFRYDTSGTYVRQVYHRSAGAGYFLLMNTSDALQPGSFFPSDPTASNFYVSSQANTNAGTYVAYLFAHDTGGIIQCGSFTTDGGGNATVALGMEPQWLLAKKSSGAGDWIILDQTRGWGATDYALSPNLSGAESTATDYGAPSGTGFSFANGGATATWVYVAIKKA